MIYWNNNTIQFARLLCEINATQDNIDWTLLCQSMDLDLSDIDDILDRAHYVWEKSKKNL
jgi:hypothetical protein